MWDAMIMNFTSAPILFFILGVLAVLIRSDLKIPHEVGYSIVIFLMISIGLRAGAAIAETPGGMLAVVQFAVLALVLGVLITAISYFIMLHMLKVDVSNSCALAASLGAVSSATLMVSISMLDGLEIPYEAFVPALYPFMDSPAIITAIFLAKMSMRKEQHLQAADGSATGGFQKSWGSLPIAESFTNTGVYILLGSMVIGLIVGPERLAREMALFDTLFRGVLCIFLLGMGSLAASRVKELKFVTPLILPFVIAASVVSGVLAVYMATFLGLSPGGAVIFASLAAGASYVTVPPVMQSSMPKANPSLYLSAAIGVVFPWNVLVGLPLYLQLAQSLAR